MTEVWVAFGVALVPWAVLTFVRLKRFLHVLQLEEYVTPLYLRWLRSNSEKYLRPPLVVAGGGVSILAAVGVSLNDDAAAWGALTAWGLLPVTLLLRDQPHSARKPLVMTSRARRLLVVGLLVAFALVAAIVAAGALSGNETAMSLGVLSAFTACALAGHVLALANLLLWPYEERGRRQWQKLAAEKLRAKRPRIIAITGSAGKTTTKELVAHLLSARHRALKTPASFNTPLGIARTVNDSYDGQEFFVVEMGAYKRDEIERLCRLVGGTDVSVITTVNAQHLERFGSLDATARAKFEIVEGLRPGGLAVLNFDVAAVRELASGAFRAVSSENLSSEILSFGVLSDDVKLKGSNLVETQAGIDFDVTWRGETAHVRTRLLARHNAENVLAAIGVGLACGLELGYMAAAVERFAPPEHRLQPLELENDVTLLDDGYNANPEGIIGALDVLRSYAPRRRVLVTSGLIEMGREKAGYHARIGEAAAAKADVVVLVGPQQTADIRDAMLASSFPEGCLHVARNPEEAQAVLKRIGQPGDVILHTTDLPDQYDEFLTI